MKQSDGILKYRKLILPLLLAALVIGGACFLRFGVLDRKGEATINISSTLTEAVDLAELSTAEFRYRGIADIYRDEEKKQVLCRVCYSAVVKAGIDMKKIRFDVDADNRVVTAGLPEIDLKVTIIDETSMALLPSDADVGIDRMLKASKEDAESEARKSGQLLNTARENLQATVEGLLYPILKANGYTLAWN